MGEGNFELDYEMIEKARESVCRLIDNLICVDFDEIESYDFPIGEPFSLEIIYENVPFYFIVKFSPSNRNLICFGPEHPTVMRRPPQESLRCLRFLQDGNGTNTLTSPQLPLQILCSFWVMK